MVPSPPPRPSPDASSIPAPSVPKENSPCLENVTGGTGPSPGYRVLSVRTVASRRRTLRPGVNHSPPSGVLRGWGGLSPSQRPLETSTFFYGRYKGYFLIHAPAGFPPLLCSGVFGPGSAWASLLYAPRLVWGARRLNGTAFFPREGDGGSQRLCEGAWWWSALVSTCAHVLARLRPALDAAEPGMLPGGMPGAAGCRGDPVLASGPLRAQISIPNPLELPGKDFQVEKEHVAKDIPLSLQLAIVRQPR